MDSVRRYSFCRLCNSASVSDILDFGESPLANSYLKKDDLLRTEFTAPLAVMQCSNCGSAQLRCSVDGSRMFSHYLYSSSDSGSVQVHFDSYASHVVEKLALPKGSFAVDVGSNDGVLLEPLQKLGLEVLGVEPASNLCERSRARGCSVVNGFFNREVAAALPRLADLITCNNCFAHIDDLEEIIQGVRLALKDGGVFVFENAYWLDTIRYKYFDQVYHEHVFYHSVKPLRMFLARHGFNIVDIEKNHSQGGSIRVYCKKTEDSVESPLAAKTIREEEEFGLYSPELYVRFSKQLSLLNKEFTRLVEDGRRQGLTFCGYGAPAKATLFCKYFGLDKNILEYIVDDAVLKQGLFMPGTQVPIVGADHFRRYPADFAILTAWNFADLIKGRNQDFKGKWIVPFPEIHVQTNAF
jgi:SAM-dependent methyltransferase